MLGVVKSLALKFVKKLVEYMQKSLVFLSLFIVLAGCIEFLYGVYVHDSFYCIFGVVGSVAYVYVNKQT